MATQSKRTRSRGWRRAVTSLLLLLGAAPLAAAQDPEPSVVAQLSAGVAKLGDSVTLQVHVEGSFEARIVGIPAIEGLELGPLRGPSRSEQQTWVGRRRRVSRQLTWQIPIRPGAAGDYEIPAIEVEVEGRVLKTSPLLLRVVQDLTGESLGFLEIRTFPERIYEGQPFTLEVRFGWDSSVEVNYVNLSLPWWGQVPGLVTLEDPEPPSSANLITGIVVNERFQVSAESLDPIERDGRRFTQLRITRNFLPSRSETTELPKSFMEFGQLLNGFLRREKRSSYFVSTSLAFDVQPLPTEGQPPDFSGAIGSIAANATIDSRDVTVGDSIKLTVTWTGAGNFEFFDPPDPSRLDSFRPFRLYGSTGEKAVDSRRVTYDLAPLTDDVDEIPSIPLSVFDPELGAYTTVETRPIPIRIRPLAEGSGLADVEGADEFARDLRDIDARPLRGELVEASGPDDRLIASLFLLVPTAWIAGRILVRRRRGDPSAPLERRRRRAKHRLRRELARARETEDVLRALQAFLAARTREPDEAWIGRTPEAWSATRANGNGRPRLPEETARELATALARLESSTYGPPSEGGPVPDRAQLLQLADRVMRAGL